jgi:hypothetical protein
MTPTKEQMSDRTLVDRLEAALIRIAELEPIKSAARRMRVAEKKQTRAWHCGDRTTVPFLVEEARKARVDLDAALAALSKEPK